MVKVSLGAVVGHSPHNIVIGNQKKRVGQSPAATHLIAGLLHQGFAVGSIDLDAGQFTLARHAK